MRVARGSGVEQDLIGARYVAAFRGRDVEDAGVAAIDQVELLARGREESRDAAEIGAGLDAFFSSGDEIDFLGAEETERIVLEAGLEQFIVDALQDDRGAGMGASGFLNAEHDGAHAQGAVVIPARVRVDLSNRTEEESCGNGDGGDASRPALPKS